MTNYEIFLFTITALFIGGSFVWLMVEMVNCIEEIYGRIIKKYFPSKYYYDWDEEA